MNEKVLKFKCLKLAWRVRTFEQITNRLRTKCECLKEILSWYR